MKPTLPIVCSSALAAMCAAAIAHWWSVREFVLAIHEHTPPATREVRVEVPSQTAPLPGPSPLAVNVAAVGAANASAGSGKMDPSLMQILSNQNRIIEELEARNRTLSEQVAETNRDLMNVGFRLDTLSDTFRPMPVSEDNMDLPPEEDINAGVLPPRAAPVLQRQPN